MVEGMELVWMELAGLCLVRAGGGEGRWRCDGEPGEVEGEPGRGGVGIRGWGGRRLGGGLGREEIGTGGGDGGGRAGVGEEVGGPDGLGGLGVLGWLVGILGVVHRTGGVGGEALSTVPLLYAVALGLLAFLPFTDAHRHPLTAWW